VISFLAVEKDDHSRYKRGEKKNLTTKGFL
jgi:hypothetical protein